MIILYICIILNILFLSCLALNNGLGKTPAMGYNSWYDLGCTHMKSQYVLEVIEAYQTLGLQKYGYEYINLDDCWAGGRDANGTIYPDKKQFPDGLTPIIKQAHAAGLKFGIYTDRGEFTCGGRVASAGHELQDAMTFASWGIDFLKEDSCNATTDYTTAFYEYSLMRDALNKTGRPIYFAICGWEPWYAPVGDTLGNEWRIGPDDYDWTNVLANVNIDADLAMYAGHGGWNNPCLLLGNNATGSPIISELQSRTQFNLWAILAAPLVLSQDIRNISYYLIETYTNEEVIAVDQDPLGKQGIRVVGSSLDANSTEEKHNTNVWARPLYDGSWALLFVNVGKKERDVTCDSNCFATLGFYYPEKFIAARDLYLHKVIWMANGTYTYTAMVPGDGGSVILRVYEVNL